jgi:hypothetical protein
MMPGSIASSVSTDHDDDKLDVTPWGTTRRRSHCRVLTARRPRWIPVLWDRGRGTFEGARDRRDDVC